MDREGGFRARAVWFPFTRAYGSGYNNARYKITFRLVMIPNVKNFHNGNMAVIEGRRHAEPNGRGPKEVPTMAGLFGNNRVHALIVSVRKHMLFGYGLGSAPEIHIEAKSPKATTSGFDDAAAANDIARALDTADTAATSSGVGTSVVKKTTGNPIMDIGDVAQSGRNLMRLQVAPAA